MKTLTLICECGTRQQFRGDDVNDIMQRIDESGWQDYPGDFPPGQQSGYCPTCMTKREECLADD